MASSSQNQPAPISQMEPWFDNAEKEALAAYLDQGGWMTEFKKTEEFEQAIADYVDARYCVVVANGTVSLTTALVASGIGHGDEVIVPDLTMFGSVTAVLLAGAKPVLVDVEASTGCLDLALAEAAITPKTKAVMVVSLNGRAPDMKKARKLCDHHKLLLLEDAAQSLGSSYHGKHLGTFGQVGSFSFSAPKIITTGQGGALVTNDEQLARRMRQVKDFGRYKAGVDLHERVGFNFKFTDLQAVIGIEQMKKLSWRVKRKKEIFALYQKELEGTPGIEFLPTRIQEVAPWFIDIFVSDPAGVREKLAAQKIGSRPIYPPMHSQDALRYPGEFPVTERLSRRGLWLPSSSFLTDEQVRRVCGAVKNAA